MTLIRHEFRRGRISLAVWTISIGILVAVCVFMFPEMKSEMEGVSEMFGSMGAFTEAFGMDRIDFGTFTGFYAIECGNILGIGGAFFAALCGVNALAREEREHTAEFLLTHPVSRRYIVSGKLCAMVVQVMILNLAVLGCFACSALIIGESFSWKEIGLLHLAYFLLQLEIAGICLGISAFLRHSGVGVGLGLAAILYFLNIVANISDNAQFLRYITPFGYAEGADILTNGALEMAYVLPGMLYGVLGAVIAYIQFSRKDIS